MSYKVIHIYEHTTMDSEILLLKKKKKKEPYPQEDLYKNAHISFYSTSEVTHMSMSR